MTARYLQVCVTAPDKQTANKLVTASLNQRLAACAQVIGPVNSTYWWQGKIEAALEWLCFLKTDAKHYKELKRVIKQLHPYDNPEIIALPIIAGSEDYLRWLKEELNPQLTKG
ncbi:MAG: divalent-cation tolerance protein CutA [bacterium]